MASKTPPSDILAGWLAGRRWYATKTRRIATLRIEDQVPLPGGTLLVARVALDDGSEHHYALPLAPTAAPDQIVDALDDPTFCHALLDLIADGGRVAGEVGEVRGVPTAAFPRVSRRGLSVRRVGGEQSNTSVAFGDTFMLKHFRRLAEGMNPEAEMTGFLTERAHFTGSPRLYGQLEYRGAEGRTTTLAVVQELVAAARDGWQWMLESLATLAGRVRQTGEAPEAVRVRAYADGTLTALHRLGALTAGLHRALASEPADPAFVPEVITPVDLAAWNGHVQAELDAARRALGNDPLPPGLRVGDGLAGLLGASKIRLHGDFHLGQTLYREASGEWVIIDFEGEPIRPLPERRLKHAAPRDVAGMLRSIDYAAVVSLAGASDGLEAWAAAWREEATRAFLAGYQAGARGAAFFPSSVETFDRAVAVFELEKAAYEVVYEANHRPDWVAIPARGLINAASRVSRAACGAA